MSLALTSRVAAGPEAVQLFRDGRELLKAGKLEAACDRFARSQKLAPKVGTLLNLGDCYERRGLTASAWAAFVEARSLAAQGGDDRRRTEANQRAEALEPDLAYVTVAIDPQITGVEIRRNGRAIDPVTWNVAIPLDPGEYEFIATAPGRRPWHHRETAAARTRAIVTVVLAVDPDHRVVVVAPPNRTTEPIQPMLVRTLGIGVLGGANTREHAFGGVRIIGNLAIPGGAIRGIATLLYSRYDDPGDLTAVPPEPASTVDTFIAGGAFEYVRSLVPQVAVAVGAGLALEIDRAAQSDVGGALSVRASPVIVRLARGRIEAGLHAQVVVASDEVRFELFAGLDWFIR